MPSDVARIKIGGIEAPVYSTRSITDAAERLTQSLERMNEATTRSTISLAQMAQVTLPGLQAIQVQQQMGETAAVSGLVGSALGSVPVFGGLLSSAAQLPFAFHNQTLAIQAAQLNIMSQGQLAAAAGNAAIGGPVGGGSELINSFIASNPGLPLAAQVSRATGYVGIAAQYDPYLGRSFSQDMYNNLMNTTATAEMPGGDAAKVEAMMRGSMGLMAKWHPDIVAQGTEAATGVLQTRTGEYTAPAQMEHDRRMQDWRERRESRRISDSMYREGVGIIDRELRDNPANYKVTSSYRYDPRMISLMGSEDEFQSQQAALKGLSGPNGEAYDDVLERQARSDFYIHGLTASSYGSLGGSSSTLAQQAGIDVKVRQELLKQMGLSPTSDYDNGYKAISGQYRAAGSYYNAQTQEILAQMQMAEDHLYNPDGTISPAYMAQYQQLAAQYRQVSAASSQSMRAGAQTEFGFGMAVAGEYASRGSAESLMAGMFGGAREAYGARMTSDVGLQTQMSSIYNFMNSGSASPQEMRQLAGEYQQVMARHIELIQRANEEYHGMISTVSGLRGATGMIQFGAAAASGVGIADSSRIGASAMPMLRQSADEAQARAQTRYNAIVAQGGNPFDNPEYVQMANEAAQKSAAVVQSGNQLAMAPLSAESRLTTAQYQFQMNIAGMLPGIGANMYAAFGGLYNQAQRNIEDINRGERTVRGTGMETDEQRYIYATRRMEQEMLQAQALSTLTTGIEGRIMTAAFNMPGDSAYVDPSFSRRAAYGAGFQNVPFFRGFGSRPGELREWGQMFGRIGSTAGFNATPGGYTSSLFAGGDGGGGNPFMNGPMNGSIPIQGEIRVILQYPDGRTQEQTAQVRNIDSASTGRGTYGDYQKVFSQTGAGSPRQQ